LNNEPYHRFDQRIQDQQNHKQYGLAQKKNVIDGDKVLLLALGVRGTYVAEKENNAQH
jgi:hypothetical protein